MTTAPNGADRSLASLFSSLARDASQLLRQELNLARSELSHNAKRASKGMGIIVGGAILLLVALQAAMGGLVWYLMNYLPPWAAFLVVAAGFAILGVIMVLIGRSALSMKAMRPDRTLQSLTDTGEWAKEQMGRPPTRASAPSHAMDPAVTNPRATSPDLQGFRPDNLGSEGRGPDGPRSIH